jgi:hypothetical protein
MPGRSEELSMSPVSNIGPGERRKRLIFGLVFLIGGLASAAALIGSGAPRGWRALLVLPFYASALGFLQARERT